MKVLKNESLEWYNEAIYLKSSIPKEKTYSQSEIGLFHHKLIFYLGFLKKIIYSHSFMLLKGFKKGKNKRE